jgi:hypothetical protein
MASAGPQATLTSRRRPDARRASEQLARASSAAGGVGAGEPSAVPLSTRRTGTPRGVVGDPFAVLTSNESPQHRRAGSGFALPDLSPINWDQRKLFWPLLAEDDRTQPTEIKLVSWLSWFGSEHALLGRRSHMVPYGYSTQMGLKWR